MPEEENYKYFIIFLILRQLYRGILVVADENGGKGDNCVFLLEWGWNYTKDWEYADDVLSIPCQKREYRTPDPVFCTD